MQVMGGFHDDDPGEGDFSSVADGGSSGNSTTLSVPTEEEPVPEIFQQWYYPHSLKCPCPLIEKFFNATPIDDSHVTVKGSEPTRFEHVHRDDEAPPQVRPCDSPNGSDTKVAFSAEDLYRAHGCWPFRNYTHLIRTSKDGQWLEGGESPLLLGSGGVPTLPSLVEDDNSTSRSDIVSDDVLSSSPNIVSVTSIQVSVVSTSGGDSTPLSQVENDNYLSYTVIVLVDTSSVGSDIVSNDNFSGGSDNVLMTNGSDIVSNDDSSSDPGIVSAEPTHVSLVLIVSDNILSSGPDIVSVTPNHVLVVSTTVGVSTPPSLAEDDVLSNGPATVSATDHTMVLATNRVPECLLLPSFWWMLCSQVLLLLSRTLILLLLKRPRRMISLSQVFVLRWSRPLNTEDVSDTYASIVEAIPEDNVSVLGSCYIVVSANATVSTLANDVLSSIRVIVLVTDNALSDAQATLALVTGGISTSSFLETISVLSGVSRLVFPSAHIPILDAHASLFWPLKKFLLLFQQVFKLPHCLLLMMWLWLQMKFILLPSLRKMMCSQVLMFLLWLQMTLFWTLILLWLWPLVESLLLPSPRQVIYYPVIMLLSQWRVRCCKGGHCDLRAMRFLQGIWPHICVCGQSYAVQRALQSQRVQLRISAWWFLLRSFGHIFLQHVLSSLVQTESQSKLIILPPVGLPTYLVTWFTRCKSSIDLFG